MKGGHHAPIKANAPELNRFDSNVCPACRKWEYSIKINNLGHCHNPDCEHKYSTRLVDGVVILIWDPVIKPVQSTLL